MHFTTRLLRRVGILRKINIITTTRVGNRNYRIPIIEGLNESLLYFRPGFKTDLLKCISSTIAVDYFVDIGANFGQTMLEIFAWKNSIRYYGFEPNLTAFGILRKLAVENRLPAELYPWACASTSSPTKLFLSSPVDQSASITPEIRPDTYEGLMGEWISAYPLDLVIENIKPPTNFILKIDVEGAEFKVLEGARRTIEAFRPIIICEVLHAHRSSELDINHEHKTKVESFLEQYKYTMYLCELSENGSDNLTNLCRIDQFPRRIWRESPKTCDYLFLPAELDKLTYSFASNVVSGPGSRE